LPPPPKDRELTLRQRLFVTLYVCGSAGVKGNATEACRMAGFSGKGGKPERVAEYARDLLKNPKVKAAVDALEERQIAKIVHSADRVLAEVARIALADPADLVDATGKLLPLRSIPEDARRAISSIEVDDKGVTKIRFWEKTRANELLGKYYKLWSDKYEPPGDNVPDELKAERAASLIAEALRRKGLAA
jgi:phage terminase small subunit